VKSNKSGVPKKSILKWLVAGWTIFAWGMFWKELVLATPYLTFYIRELFRINFEILNRDSRQLFVAYTGSISSPEISQAIIFVFGAFFVFWVMFFFATFLIAQFVLPVSMFENRVNAFKLLLRFMLGQHGPAVFVKGGKVVAKEGELKKKGAGVALVDLNSALVLQRRMESLPKQVSHWENDVVRMENNRLNSRIVFGQKSKTNAFTRVVSPGFAFIDKNEKVLGSFDLRAQTRNLNNVVAVTSEGVEVKTRVFVSFSLSKEPEVIRVAFVGGGQPEHLKQVKLFEDKERNKFVVEGVYQIDLADAEEVFDQIEKEESTNSVINGQANNDVETFHKLDPLRIKRAASASLGKDKDGHKLVLFDLPVQIASGIFRRMISSQSFDDLYMFDDPDQFPLNRDFRQQFIQNVKYQGLLAYQLVTRIDSVPFSGKLGEEFSIGDVQFSQQRNLKKDNFQKVLRNQGIVILNAGFGDLQTDEKVYRKIVDKWEMRWERDIRFLDAKHELEAMRILNATRAQMQREMTYLLSDVFQSDPHSEEALALRAFQALEIAAANPGDEITPKEILNTLQNLYEWLLNDRGIKKGVVTEFSQRQRQESNEGGEDHFSNDASASDDPPLG
jgi:hypothetical protein